MEQWVLSVTGEQLVGWWVLSVTGEQLVGWWVFSVTGEQLVGWWVLQPLFYCEQWLINNVSVCSELLLGPVPSQAQGQRLPVNNDWVKFLVTLSSFPSTKPIPTSEQ